MKEIINLHEKTVVVRVDRRFDSDAHHSYQIVTADYERFEDFPQPPRLLTQIDFQYGSVKENGVNGCTDTDLIKIVHDRLEYIRSGKNDCEEHVETLRYLGLALKSMEDHQQRLRTENREANIAKRNDEK